MGEAVEESAGEALGAEHLGPFVEGQIGGDQGRAPLVALAEHLEQELGAGLGQRHEAEFVDGLGSPEWRSLHVAVYLNAEPLDDVADYCAAAGNLEIQAPAEPLSVRMVFCNGRELYSTTVARLPEVTGAGDGAFHKLLAQMTRGLWPLHYLDAQMGSSQKLLEFRQSNLAYPELFGFGFNTVRKLLGPNGNVRRVRR